MRQIPVFLLMFISLSAEATNAKEKFAQLTLTKLDTFTKEVVQNESSAFYAIGFEAKIDSTDIDFQRCSNETDFMAGFRSGGLSIDGQKEPCPVIIQMSEFKVDNNCKTAKLLLSLSARDAAVRGCDSVYETIETGKAQVLLELLDFDHRFINSDLGADNIRLKININ